MTDLFAADLDCIHSPGMNYQHKLLADFLTQHQHTADLESAARTAGARADTCQHYNQCLTERGPLVGILNRESGRGQNRGHIE